MGKVSPSSRRRGEEQWRLAICKAVCSWGPKQCERRDNGWCQDLIRRIVHRTALWARRRKGR